MLYFEIDVGFFTQNLLSHDKNPQPFPGHVATLRQKNISSILSCYAQYAHLYQLLASDKSLCTSEPKFAEIEGLEMDMVQDSVKTLKMASLFSLCSIYPPLLPASHYTGQYWPSLYLPLSCKKWFHRWIETGKKKGGWRFLFTPFSSFSFPHLDDDAHSLALGGEGEDLQDFVVKRGLVWSHDLDALQVSPHQSQSHGPCPLHQRNL